MGQDRRSGLRLSRPRTGLAAAAAAAFLKRAWLLIEGTAGASVTDWPEPSAMRCAGVAGWWDERSGARTHLEALDRQPRPSDQAGTERGWRCRSPRQIGGSPRTWPSQSSPGLRCDHRNRQLPPQPPANFRRHMLFGTRAKQPPACNPRLAAQGSWLIGSLGLGDR